MELCLSLFPWAKLMLGEALLNLGKKEEVIEAYKKKGIDTAYKHGHQSNA